MSIQVNAITNTTYQNNQNIRSVDLNYKPWVYNRMYVSFSNCTNLQSVSNISNTVTNMSYAFDHCTNLVNAPVIPNSVTDMYGTFRSCSKLVNAPIIPNSVIHMSNTFENCYNLVNAPTIPNSISSMTSTFSECRNLINVPEIPNSATAIGMHGTFEDCTSLVNAPVIYNSTTMSNTFRGCNKLTGNIYIYSNKVANATGCFGETNLTKNVYIPFKNANRTNSATYNSFIAAGYSTTVRKDGVLLFDIDNPEPVVNEYEYTVLSSGKVDLTKYIGSGGAIVTPTIIG